MNLNSADYWNGRFLSGDWDASGGPRQTSAFARAQVRRLDIPGDFNGTLLDFGCGLGDAFPVYRRRYPRAKLIGVDISPFAIRRCAATYGSFAEFLCGDHSVVPKVDVIVTSNVLEHLDDDTLVARSLLGQCRHLYVVVPYKEQYLIDEHLRRYDGHSFEALRPVRVKVFASEGWSQYGLRALWWEIRVKNVLRPLLGKRRVQRRLQILYHFMKQDNPGPRQAKHNTYE